MEISGHKVLVVGAGKTGLEAAKFLMNKGAQVTISDSAQMDSLSPEIKALGSRGVRIEAGGHGTDTFTGADMIVVSPGVPLSIPVLKEASQHGVEIISEIELASRFIATPIIAVTGSNGKTTTTTMIARILESAGQSVFLGGNIGTPPISIVEKSDEYDYLVLEVSSFQLEATARFKPHIALLLNITPNHLDHHQSYKEYIDAKMRIFKNQTPDDYAIYNSEDGVIDENMPDLGSVPVTFGYSDRENGVWSDGQIIHYKDESFDLRGMKLVGKHNIENAMAAVAVAIIIGCPREIIEREIREFHPLPYRIEYVGEVEGVAIYNDSKSTSPAATASALKSLGPRTILIAGGKDKGTSFDALIEPIKQNAKLLILLGETKHRMRDELGEGIETRVVDTLEDAVSNALEHSSEGDKILFSPACSSFDMFGSYEERGRRFQEIVSGLGN